MGLLDRFRGGGKEEEPDFDEVPEEEFEDEFDDDFDEVDGDGGDDKEEWETAYQFTKDALQARGFSSPKEFIQKAMVYRINKSPLYRDRVKVGRQTMKMVSDTMAMQDEMFGGGEQSYDELATELESANKLIDEVEKFSNKEEQMAQEILGLAGDAVEVFAERSTGGGGASVPSNVRTSEEEL